MVAGPCLCGRTFANAGNLANHRKRCLASRDDVQAPPAPTVQFPESVVAEYMDEDLMPHQQDHAMMQQDREVQLTPDRYLPDTVFSDDIICPISIRFGCHMVSESG